MSNTYTYFPVALLTILVLFLGSQVASAEDMSFVISEVNKTNPMTNSYEGHLSDWSSDGRYILVSNVLNLNDFSDDSILLIIDLEDDSIKQLSIPPEYDPTGFVTKNVKFHSDEHVIYLSNGNEGVFKLDTETNEVELVIDRNVAFFDISADGKKIIFTERIGQFEETKYNLFVSDIDGSDQRLILEDVPWKATLSPDNRKIAFIDTTGHQYSQTGTFKIYDFKTKSWDEIPDVSLRCADVFRFDHTGDFLFYGDIGCSKTPPYNSGLFVTSLHGDSEQLLDVGDYDVRGMVVHPNGGQMVFQTTVEGFNKIQFEKYPQKNFDSEQDDISFILDKVKEQHSDDSNKEGGGCLIATAAYGTELAPQVQFLREIRDSTVMSTSSGTAFMAGFNPLYYSFSPVIADLERENPMFQETIRAFITPMISTLSIMTLVDSGSEIEVVGLGISVIALNLGLYIAGPAVAVWQIKKRI